MIGDIARGPGWHCYKTGDTLRVRFQSPPDGLTVTALRRWMLYEPGVGGAAGTWYTRKMFVRDHVLAILAKAQTWESVGEDAWSPLDDDIPF